VKLLNVKTSALEEVADPQAAIVQGSHAAKSSEVFTFQDPSDGGVYEATGDELAPILRAGGVLETELDRRHREVTSKYSDSPILAGAAGAARGLTFGLSDAALAAGGLSEDVAALKEQNPYSSVLGEVGGIIIPTLLSGGTTAIGGAARVATTATRAVTRGAESVAAGLVEGGVARTIAAGAAEGATYGLGQSISAASLGEPANVAENLLIGGALGGLVPAAIAGLKSGGKVAVEKGFPKVTAMLGGGDATELEKFYQLSGAGKTTRQLVKTGPEAVQTRLIEVSRQVDETARHASAYFGETKMAKAEELLGHLKPEDVAVKTGNFEKLRLKFDDVLNQFSSRPNSYDSGIAKEIRVLGDEYVQTMSKATTAADGFKALDELKRKLNTASKVMAKNQTPQEILASKAAKELEQTATNILEDSSVWGNAATMQQKMNSAYKDFVDSQKAFNKYFRSQFGNETRVDAKKIINFSKNRGTPAASDMAEALDGYLSSANSLRNVIAEHAPQMQKIAGKGGASAATAESKLMTALDELGTIQKYEEMGGGIRNRALFTSSGVKDILSMANPTGKFAVQVLTAAETALSKVNQEWLGHMGTAFKSLQSSVPAKVATEISSLSDANAQGQEILRLAGNPDALGAHVADLTGQLQLAAPEVAQVAQLSVSSAVQYLAQRVPADPEQGMYGPNPSWKPSDAESAVWKRHLDAAQQPMNLIKDFSAGNLAPETVETVKALYPAFYQQTTQGIAQYLGDKKPNMPFSRRLQLSVLMQSPIEPSLRKANLRELQMSYAEAPEAQQPSGGKPISIDAAGQMTPGQRLGNR
jgi:hypothetical protein